MKSSILQIRLLLDNISEVNSEDGNNKFSKH